MWLATRYWQGAHAGGQNFLSEKGMILSKSIFITGTTDGIGLGTAKMLASQGHTVLLHGRNPEKLADAERTLAGLSGGVRVKCYLADLSRMADVEALANDIAARQSSIDVLINNDGIFRSADNITPDGLDLRFAVNTIAPYLLTKRLLPLMGPSARVINLSSAAQSPVDPEALAGRARLDDMAAYAQSKLALTMWSREMALALKDGPAIIAVNPGSMLGTKMVKEGFGVQGADIRIGADILTRATLAEEFAAASGKYFDNDSGRFAAPHPEALDARKTQKVVRIIEGVLAETAH